ncbi:SSI family serine proteinase inhibitor [Streptomyces monticola]|uniref:SSI family serine proteinase inhibitor n=1 Tax=Streptomyces monticola TaxID=2666263 RepID=A0ABW2JQF9_9ACTN
MRPSVLAAAALLVLAPAVPVIAPAVPAYAADSAPVRPGLFLTVSGSENTWIRGVKLHCTPKPARPHPKAEAACAALDAARGDLGALADQPLRCTKLYDPVTVSASGTHRGRPIGWHKTYSNLCVMKADTGPVFDF